MGVNTAILSTSGTSAIEIFTIHWEGARLYVILKDQKRVLHIFCIMKYSVWYVYTMQYVALERFG